MVDTTAIFVILFLCSGMFVFMMFLIKILINIDDSLHILADKFVDLAVKVELLHVKEGIRHKG